MPAGRKKSTGVVGSVCKFTLDIKDSSYTGLFKNGEKTGLIRFILTDFAFGRGAVPEAAIKFLRSGTTSANVVFARSLLGTSGYPDNYNIFDPELNTLGTIVYPCHFRNDFYSRPWQGQQFYYKHLQGSKCPNRVGLSDIARYTN